MLTKEQLEIRRGGISGSEIGALVGLSRFKKPIDVYLSKVEGYRDNSSSYHTERGSHLGPAIVEWYMERTGKVVTHYGNNEKTLVSDEFPLCVATPDGLEHVAGRSSSVTDTVETKAPSFHCHGNWGEAGTDQIPDYDIPQVTWQMKAARVLSSKVVPLIDGDIRVYSVPFDDELFHVMYEEAERFWVDHVLAKVPPPPDGSHAHSEYLARKFPKNSGFIAKADDRVARLMSEYRTAKDALESAEQVEERIKQMLKDAIGEFDGFEADGVGKVTWRTCKGRQSTDWQGLARNLGATDEKIAEFTKQGDSYRRFVASFKKGV